MAQRIGLYGGTFDPVHIGHLLVAQAALEELALDQLVFIPAGRSPFKPTTSATAGEIRARMLRVALAGETRAHVDTSELEREGISYSINTIRSYSNRFPDAEIFYLMGADHVPSLPKWRNADELAATVEFYVVPRPGEVRTPFPPPFRGGYLGGTPTEMSASAIRKRVSEKKSISQMVPPGVAEIIENNHLYL